MNKFSRPGIHAILEIASADIDRIKPLFKSDDSKDRLIQIISNYLMRKISFDEALGVFNEETGHCDTIYKMREIVEVDPTPIPSDDDPESASKKSRSWSAAEDIRLLAGIYRFGLDNWSSISVFVGNNRTRAQCAQRWSRGLNPRISKETWSPEDEAKLLNYVRQFGEKSWTKIAALIGNRSDVQCRYHYHQITKNGKPIMLTPMFANPVTVLQPVRVPLRLSMPSLPNRIGENADFPMYSEERRASMFTPMQQVAYIQTPAYQTQTFASPVAEVEKYQPQMSYQTAVSSQSIDGFLQRFQ